MATNDKKKLDTVFDVKLRIVFSRSGLSDGETSKPVRFDIFLRYMC